jgi:hypothetical protein
MKQVKVSSLHPWDENPRDISREKFNQLLKQMRFGEVENLIVMKDGTVLNGNRRLDAYHVIGKEEAWVSEIEFIDDEDGKYAMLVDGELAIHKFPHDIAGTTVLFDSPKQGMVQLMTLGNTHVGTFNDLMLAELVSEVNIESDLFEIDLKASVPLEDLIAAFGPTQELDIMEDETESELSQERVKEIKFFLAEDKYHFVNNVIKAASKQFGYTNPNEVLLEAMIAVSERLEGIVYNG